MASSSSNVIVEQTPEPVRPIQYGLKMNLQEWFDNAPFCNYRLGVVHLNGTEESILINKGLLITHFAYFRTMFESGMVESKEDSYMFKDFPGGFPYLRAILVYIHGGVSTPMASTGIDHILMVDAMGFLGMETEDAARGYFVKSVYTRFIDSYKNANPGMTTRFLRSMFAPRPVPVLVESIQSLVATWIFTSATLTRRINKELNDPVVAHLMECYPKTGTASKINILRILRELPLHRDEQIEFILGQPVEHMERMKDLAEEEFGYVESCCISTPGCEQLIRRRACQYAAMGECKEFLEDGYWAAKKPKMTTTKKVCKECMRDFWLPSPSPFFTRDLCERCTAASDDDPVLEVPAPPARGVKRKLDMVPDTPPRSESPLAAPPAFRSGWRGNNQMGFWFEDTDSDDSDSDTSDSDDDVAGVGLIVPPAPKKPRKQ